MLSVIARALSRASLLVLVAAVPALAGPTVQIVSPPPGEAITDLTPTFTVTFSADAATGSIELRLNGLQMSPVMTEGTATFDVEQELAAGTLKVEAIVTDASGMASTTRDYDVLPTLLQPSPPVPVVGRYGDRLTIEIAGLDLTGSNVALFPAGTPGEYVAAQMEEVDPDNHRAVATVPNGAANGPLRVEVNGKRSLGTRDFTLVNEWTYCGQPRQFIAMPDGSMLVQHIYYWYARLPVADSPDDCPNLPTATSDGDQNFDSITLHRPNGHIQLVHPSLPGSNTTGERPFRIAQRKTAWNGNPRELPLAF